MTWPVPIPDISGSQTYFSGNDHALDLGGTLADLQDLGVPPEPGDRVLVHEAVPAVDLGRLPGVGHRDLTRVQLGDGSLALELPAVGDPGGRVIPGQPGGVGAHVHVGELERDRLEVADRPAERVP